ncbi:otoferlin-like isoform X2 [Epargyreus clarus]|uniref:otoferlin-like isoform X2 n=1 Tax=Epargyreus clarus TaxID=520877 RepID=UPI003C2BC332
MRPESPEERGRQKVAGPPSYRTQNEYNPEAMPQYFQISVGILEGRNFSWFNARSANSYVVITLGKKKHRTNLRKNEQEPHYKESFVFEMYASIYDLERSSLCLTVLEPRCCAPPRLLGEADVDLGAVWEQPYHQVLRKWAQLSLPRDPSAGSVGFLKVDISITCRGDGRIITSAIRSQSVTRQTNVDVNYLLSSGSELQHANYIITVYGAFGLPNTSRHQNDRHHCAKPPNTFVRLLFCGLQAKTAVQNRSNNPMYCEQVSMVEMFPNPNQTFQFEVCSTDTFSNRLLASTFLNLDRISYDGENGFLPTFGPSLLPMYGSPCPGAVTTFKDSPYYRGSLLVSLSTTVPYYQQSVRSISVEPVTLIPVENLWTLEEFCMFCPIFEISMLDSRMVSRFCGVAVTIGELSTEGVFQEEFTAMMNEMKSRKLHYTGSLDVLRAKSEYGHVDFSNTYPVLQLATRLPDYRFRMYRNNAIYGIVRTLESAFSEIEQRLTKYDYTSLSELSDEAKRALDIVVSNISKFLEKYNNENIEQYRTELDKKQIILQLEEMKRIRQKILQIPKLYAVESLSRNNAVKSTTSRKDIKSLLTEVNTVVRQLNKIIYKATEGWPDIVIWLLNNGSRVGFCKISAADIMYSDIPELSGKKCGEIQTVYLKPLKCSRHVSSLSMGCFCVVGKVELLAWMGLHEHSSAFEQCMPIGYKLKIKDFNMCVKCGGIMIECRVFIYKARLFCHNGGSDLGHVFLRINTSSGSKSSKAVEKSLTPVWNQFLSWRKMMFTSSERLIKYPPVVLVEINSTDLQGKTDLVGSFQMEAVVDDRNDFNSAPKLQWYEMYKGMESTGKVLMSIQILQVPEKILKSMFYTQDEDCFVSSDINEFDESFTDIGQLPASLIPRTSTYKVDIYWWGLREVNITKKPCVVLEIEDLVVKSEVIPDKKSNCNFPNGRVTQVFEASLSEPCCPPINMKLYDNCTFGRTLYLGTKVVKKPNKFLTTWYPKTEREASLKRGSITSADFVKVSQNQYVKKRNSFDDGEDAGNFERSSSSLDDRLKRSRWRRLFCRKEPDEEEYTLLPIFTRENTKNVVRKPPIRERKDWWSTYIASQKVFGDEDVSNGGNFVIYDSELELQPQFSKFKDWCATLKLYNGEKTGVPEKDEKLQCGLLKAGIAIYKWPPPQNTAAVSTNGVDLDKGFFHDYPNNDPEKFIVRVYVIKAMDLTMNNFTGKSHPYVVISSGRKNLGDRNSYIPNTFNPIFGTVYELRCSLPDDYRLTVSLFNYDVIEPDELIGSSTIDLEDRIYTKHRARVGLAPEYNLSDPGKWRDCVKPSAILEEMCAKNHLPPPRYPDASTVVVNGVEYKDNEQAVTYDTAQERRENICLNLLRNWDTLPVCGYPLVPQHVETRSLYNPEIPGVEQGKLHMWIDIFPLDSGIYIPPPVNITHSKTEEYELRVTIFDVKLFKKRTEDCLSNSNMYIRAWMGFADQIQNTNACSICSNGHYKFDWCMIFNFKYDHAERKLMRRDRQFTDYDENVPPVLVIQLVDSDSLSLDDYIGSHERSAEKRYVGVIKIHISLLPKQTALLMPVGIGRDPQVTPPAPRLRRTCSRKIYDIKNFFYKHNALWGSLTGISIIIFIAVVIIYLIYDKLLNRIFDHWFLY